jgi:hypothetical protein
MAKSVISDVLRGRVRAPDRDDARFVVELVDDEHQVIARARTGNDGRFTLRPETELGEKLALVVRRSRSGPVLTDVPIDADNLDADVVVALPEPPRDPRETVAAVAEALQAEEEATASAREILSRRMKAVHKDDERVAGIVRAIVSDLVPTGGLDLRFKVSDEGDASRGGGTKRDVPSVMRSAVKEGRARLAASPRTVRARKGRLKDGAKLSSREVIRRLSGRSETAEGYRRLSARERRQRERENEGADGLPQPGSSDTAPNGSQEDSPRGENGSAADPMDTVRERGADLIEAIRLPEDPPLLLADEPVAGRGESFELRSGIADVTAFHDFHELVLAMPNVWQDVFDKRLTEVVGATVHHLLTAGVDVDAIVNATNARTRPGGRLAALVDAARASEALFSTTSASRIRPAFRPLRSPPSSPISGLALGEGAIVDIRRGPGGFDPRVPHVPPPDGVGISEDDQGPKLDDSALPPPDLLDELESFLSGEYAFTVFAADGSERAMNFGLLVTWREMWAPGPWQAGNIAHTMTLAPGEERKVVTRRRQSLKRYWAEAQKAQRGRSTETTDTTRAETEILRKADASTNFQLTSQGSTKLLVADGSFTTSGTRDASKGTSDTRRRFREAVVKSAQEYREENSMEVRTESEDIFEEETTATVVNKNDEIAMTAVYYELSRRYVVSEQLYRMRPVILVAMPVPEPSEITAGWIVRNDWILRRALLDADFERAIVYLATSYLGDRDVLAHLEESVVEHRTAVEQTRLLLSSARALAEQRADALNKLQTALAEGRDPGGLEIPGLDLVVDAISFGNLVGDLFGNDDDEAQRRERERMLVEAAEDELARAERRAQEAETQLAAATSAYQEAVRAFVEAKREARNQDVQIARLRVHIKDNLFHYLQAIWSSQPPDQRFFELHALEVPGLNASIRLSSQGAIDDGGVGGFTQEQFEANFIADDGSQLEFRPLAEVADLDQLLGFKGNYAIFPLREGNALTDFILAPYLDEHEILRDADDPAANWTLTDLREYADELRADIESGVITQQQFDKEFAPFLRRRLKELLTDPTPSEETIVVPSHSLYVDLLTSGGTLLEPFKLEHRALDVAKVRAETRQAELENLRFAARVFTDEFDDPAIDKRIVVEGDGVLLSPGDQ